MKPTGYDLQPNRVIPSVNLEPSTVPLYSINENDLRHYCKRAIENLEKWLRRLIHQKLVQAYGSEYIDAMTSNGDRVVKGELARKLAKRCKDEPARYPTPIDAALLDDVISLICNSRLYGEHFRAAMQEAFPDGEAEARTFLKRLVPVRNTLYHANTISVHDAYRVLCYSEDVVHSLKQYYKALNMQQQFNAPAFIGMTDSLGHSVMFSDANRMPDAPVMVDFSGQDDGTLYPGDTLSIEVEIDPTFDPESYSISWTIANASYAIPTMTGSKFMLQLDERHTMARFTVVCFVTSKASWHRHGYYDDQLDIAYRVFPPV